MRQIHLVYCIPSLSNPGGMERVLTQKVNYLAATGRYAITLITVEQGRKQVYFPLDESVEVVDLDIDFKSHFDRNLFVKTWLHLNKLRQYKKKLSTYLRLYPADFIISLCGKEIDFIGSLNVPGIRIAEIHFAHDFRKQFSMASHRGKLWKWFGIFRTWQLENQIRKLSCLVVLSKADADTWKWLKGRIVQIYNPVESVAEARMTTYQKKIIAVGRLEPQKGFDYLIEAWQYVAVKHPEWALHIWGEGTCRPLLERMIAEEKLENQVLLKGTTKYITAEYLTSYANVASSRYEGFPMSLLEAMACRLPLVSFDCPCGPAELIQEGQNGFLVALSDSKGLAERICRLIEDPTLRERMAEKSLSMVKAYHPEKIMKQWMDLFDLLRKK